MANVAAIYLSSRVALAIDVMATNAIMARRANNEQVPTMRRGYRFARSIH